MVLEGAVRKASIKTHIQTDTEKLRAEIERITREKEQSQQETERKIERITREKEQSQQETERKIERITREKEQISQELSNTKWRLDTALKEAKKQKT